MLMEDFDTKAINTATNLPRLWRRCLKDIFVTQKTEQRTQFLEHINSISPHIQFTAEDANTDRSAPFLDTCYTKTWVYFLHHSTENLLTHRTTYTGTTSTTFLPSIVCLTHSHRVRTFVQTHNCYKVRRCMSRGPLKSGNFPIGHSVDAKLKTTTHLTPTTVKPETSNKNSNIHMVVSYTKRWNERFKNVWLNWVSNFQWG